jgi:hypothetical protein
VIKLKKKRSHDISHDNPSPGYVSFPAIPSAPLCIIKKTSDLADGFSIFVSEGADLEEKKP